MSKFQESDGGIQDDRAPWSPPQVIVGTRARDTQKFESGIGYEYHETDGVGGGSTQLS